MLSLVVLIVIILNKQTNQLYKSLSNSKLSKGLREVNSKNFAISDEQSLGQT